MTDRNQNCQNEKVSIQSDVQRGSANWQMSFSGRGNAWKNCSFQGTDQLTDLQIKKKVYFKFLIPQRCFWKILKQVEKTKMQLQVPWLRKPRRNEEIGRTAIKTKENFPTIILIRFLLFLFLKQKQTEKNDQACAAQVFDLRAFFPSFFGVYVVFFLAKLLAIPNSRIKQLTFCLFSLLS